MVLVGFIEMNNRLTINVRVVFIHEFLTPMLLFPPVALT